MGPKYCGCWGHPVKMEEMVKVPKCCKGCQLWPSCTSKYLFCLHIIKLVNSPRLHLSASTNILLDNSFLSLQDLYRNTQAIQVWLLLIYFRFLQVLALGSVEIIFTSILTSLLGDTWSFETCLKEKQNLTNFEVYQSAWGLDSNQFEIIAVSFSVFRACVHVPLGDPGAVAVELTQLYSFSLSLPVFGTRMVLPTWGENEVATINMVIFSCLFLSWCLLLAELYLR